MKKTKLPSLIPVLIMTLITVIMWVSLDIYRAFKKPAEAVVPTEVSQPFIPSLDQNVINQVESRTFLNDSQVPDNIVNSSPTPAGRATPSPTIIPIAQPTALPVMATESGTTP
jgi:hypothetical protein